MATHYEDFLEIVEKSVQNKLILYNFYNFYSDENIKEYINIGRFSIENYYSNIINTNIFRLTSREILNNKNLAYNERLYYLLEHRNEDYIKFPYYKIRKNTNILYTRLDIYFYILYKPHINFQKIMEKYRKKYKDDVLFKFLYYQSSDREDDIINIILFNHFTWCYGKIAKIYVLKDDFRLNRAKELRIFLKNFFKENIFGKFHLINYDRSYINYLAYHDNKDDYVYLEHIEKRFSEKRECSVLGDIILIHLRFKNIDIVEEYIYKNMDIIVTKFTKTNHSVGLIYRYLFHLTLHKKKDSRFNLLSRLNYIFFNYMDRIHITDKNYHLHIFSKYYNRYKNPLECYICLDEFKEGQYVIACKTCLNSVVHYKCTIRICGFCRKEYIF
jgi:hypothetical protein